MQSVHRKSNEYSFIGAPVSYGKVNGRLMTVTSLQIDVSRETLLLASDDRLPRLLHRTRTN